MGLPERDSTSFQRCASLVGAGGVASQLSGNSHSAYRNATGVSDCITKLYLLVNLEPDPSDDKQKKPDIAKRTFTRSINEVVKTLQRHGISEDITSKFSEQANEILSTLKASHEKENIPTKKM